MMKIGIIREGKTPPDSRACLTPSHCVKLKELGYDIVVQPSEVRVFKDEEYIREGIVLQEDLRDRDILIGVKEVPIHELIPNKTYFFFSHTFKKQVYNRPLLQAILEKKIKLIDYEAITNKVGQRLIAFGKFAGIVGAHNALYTYMHSQGEKDFPRMHTFFDYAQAKKYYSSLKLSDIRVVITGAGRVANGAASVLNDMGITKVSPLEFVLNEYDIPVYTQLISFDYAKRKDGRTVEFISDFFNNPKDYVSQFRHFFPFTDIFINGIYWDNAAPAFFTLEDMKSPDFSINTIADITCDIAPKSSIPSTIRPSTIDNPIYGFDRFKHKETAPFKEGSINVMAIDNLPNELPRDASLAFGDMFIEHVIPELNNPDSEILFKASITDLSGNLNTPFKYLESFVAQG